MWGFTVTQIFVVINSLSQMLLIALTCTQNIPLTAFGMKQNKRCVTHLLWDCTSSALININKADKIRISMADMIHINTEAVAAFLMKRNILVFWNPVIARGLCPNVWSWCACWETRFILQETQCLNCLWYTQTKHTQLHMQQHITPTCTDTCILSSDGKLLQKTCNLKWFKSS